MKIQIASDLHLERARNNVVMAEKPLNVAGDVLVLAGDICNINKMMLAKEFMDKVKEDFERVIYVPGNHEYYGVEYEENRYSKFVQKDDNVVYLNNSVYVYKDVRFICSTMWSGVKNETTNYINDYFVIGGFNQLVENTEHRASLRFIEGELVKKWSGKTIVVTHHLPLWECIDEEYIGSPINDAFASDQSKLFDYDIDVWIHGHSHGPKKLVKEDTLVIRNPLGYIGYSKEGLYFDRSCIVEV